MNKQLIAILVASLLGLGLAGCKLPDLQSETTDADLVETSYHATDMLLTNMRRPLDPSKPIIVASFVSVDNLRDSSSLGRILAEQTASRLTQQGYTVIEMKMRDNVFIQRRGGEFTLSRELKAISKSHDAQAVVAGTYATAKEIVYVTTRVVRTTDSVLMSAHDFSMPIGKDTKALLRSARR